MSAEDVTPEDRARASARLAAAALVLREAVVEARRCGIDAAEVRRLVESGARRKRAKR